MLNAWLILSGLAAVIFALAWVWIKERKSTIVVATYGDDYENKFLMDLIREFTKKYPHIQVDLVQFQFNVYAHEVLAAAKRGECPDVLLMELSHYTEFIFEEFLEPVYPYFLDDRLKITDFYPLLADRFFLDGFLNVVPRDAAPICMVYYNKKAFDEAGVPYPRDDWDWDQFVETAKKVMKVDSSGKVVRWGFVECWAMLENWVYSAGGSYVDYNKNPTRWTFDEDRDTLRGIQFRWDLIFKHKVMPPPSVWTGYNDLDSVEMFADGKVAMFLCGFWKTPRFREIKDFDWDVAMIPRDPLGNLNFGVGGSGYGITKASRNKKNAWKLVKFLSSEQGSKKMAEASLALPALMKVASSPAFLDDQKPLNKKLLLEAMKRGKFPPLCKNWTMIKSHIDEEFRSVWDGKLTIQEAMGRLKALLEKNPPVNH